LAIEAAVPTRRLGTGQEQAPTSRIRRNSRLSLEKAPMQVTVTRGTYSATINSLPGYAIAVR
jgi:hypothetical protein